MSSITITQIAPVQHTVVVNPTVTPLTLEITEQVTQPTVVVSPQNITNYYGGGGEVLASLTGVAPQSTDLGTFTEDIIADNETIKGALQDLENGVVNNEAAIGTNASDITTNATGISNNATDITGLTTTVNGNTSSIGTNTSSIGTNTSDITTLETTVGNLTTGALTQSLDPTELSLFFTDPGTYSSGTAIEAVLRDILIHFQPPSITSFSAVGLPNASIEHGATDTLTSASWNVTNPNNVDAAITGQLQYVDPVGTDDETWTGVAHTASPYSINKNVTFSVSLVNVGQATTTRGQTNQYYLRFSGLVDTQGNGLSNRTDYFTVLFRTFVLTSPTAITAGSVTDQTGTDLIDDAIAGTGGATVEYNNLHADSLQQVTLTYPDTLNYWYAVMPQCHWEYANKVTTDQGFAGFEITATIVDCGAFVYNNANSQNVAMQVLRGPSIGQIGSGKYIKFEYDSGVALNTPVAPASGNRGGGSSSPAVQYLLDLYTGAAAAYSTRRLYSLYTGAALRVREDSGDTETDIGFDSNGDLDTAAIATHCGTANGYVTKWYDQSTAGGTGSGNDATQITPGEQPQIYDGASVITENGKPTIKFIRTSNTALDMGTLPDFSSNYFGASVSTVTIGNQVCYIYNTNTDYSTHGVSAFYTGGKAAISSAVTGSSSGKIAATATTNSQILHVGQLVSGTLSLFVDGTEETASTSWAPGTGNYIGRRSDGQFDMEGNIQEVVLWNTDESPDRSGIETNINSEYLIYQPTDAPTSGLLATYPGAAAAYSVRQLANTAIMSMRVRRDSDDTEQNFGFDSNGDLDTAGIASFCGSANGYVSQWWDQSTNGNHASQGTAGNQPQIYDGSAVITENGKPLVSGGLLSLTGIPYTNSIHSTFYVCRFDANAIYASATGSGAGQYQAVHRGGAIFERIGGVTSYHQLASSATKNAQHLIAILDDATTTTSSVDGTSGSVSSAGTWTANLTMTHRGEYGLSADVKIQELIIYQSDESTNQTGIETNINDYFSIY